MTIRSDGYILSYYYPYFDSASVKFQLKQWPIFKKNKVWEYMQIYLSYTKYPKFSWKCSFLKQIYFGTVSGKGPSYICIFSNHQTKWVCQFFLFLSVLFPDKTLFYVWLLLKKKIYRYMTLRRKSWCWRFQARSCFCLQPLLRCLGYGLI